MHLPAVFPDPFAVEWGHDQYGTFQSFAVGNVVQRMRWIPPGSFMMGSPESEVGRFVNELQHKVEIPNGLWLGETPVTQALWEAVIGTNPSQFRGPDNPVEQVSWQDCQEFIGRLNIRDMAVEARLPTEAEWEYSCRAGTTTATWAGDLQPGQETEAPLLDAIAWYGGHRHAQTHPVAQKQPNPWGLYDILGNVYEWCADWFAPYDIAIVQSPSDRQEPGAERVCRGGSWRSGARYARSAYRMAIVPEMRYVRLGFRLARSATPRYSIEK